MNKYTIEGNKERLGLGSTRQREIGEKPREREERGCPKIIVPRHVRKNSSCFVVSIYFIIVRMNNVTVLFTQKNWKQFTRKFW